LDRANALPADAESDGASASWTSPCGRRRWWAGTRSRCCCWT